MTKTMAEWWHDLQEAGAVWQHPGELRAPHVVLRSGQHSDGFVDTLRYLSNLVNHTRAAHALAERIGYAIGKMKINWVFGSPMAGIPFATTVASILGAENIGFTEKQGGNDKNLICRLDVEPGETVLLIEEMTTSGQTPQRAMDAILKKNPEAKIIRSVGAFLIRCTAHPSDLRAALVPVISLPDLQIFFREMDPDKCTLCETGSRAIPNPKLVWKHLLATMTDPDHRVPSP